MGTSGQNPAWVLVPLGGGWVQSWGCKENCPPGVAGCHQPPGTLRGEATVRASKFVTLCHPPTRISTPNPALSFSRAASAPPRGGFGAGGAAHRGLGASRDPRWFRSIPCAMRGGGHRDTGRVPSLEVCPEHPTRGGQRTDRQTQTGTDRRTRTGPSLQPHFLRNHTKNKLGTARCARPDPARG